MRGASTYGVLPTRAEYDALFEAEVPGGVYRIRGPQAGTCEVGLVPGDYSRGELWEYLVALTYSDEDSHHGVASDILFTLGWEWI